MNDIPSVSNPAFPKSNKNAKNDDGVITCRQDVLVGFLLQVSCQYHCWISSYDNFYL